MPVKNSVKAIAITSISSAALTGSFTVANSALLTQPCFYLRINNASDALIEVSYDGSTINDVVLPNDKLNLPVQQNAQPPAWIANFPRNMRVYIRGTAGTGTIYISGYYSPQGV